MKMLNIFKMEKRNNIIKRLIESGFSEKTLVSLSDKQIYMLSNRILNEQSINKNINNKNTLKVPKTYDDIPGLMDYAKKRPNTSIELTEFFDDNTDNNDEKKIISFQTDNEDFDSKNLPYKIALPEHLPFKLSNGKYQHSYCVSNKIETDTDDMSGEIYEEKDKKWIQKAIKKPGSLKKALNIGKDEKIPEKKLNTAVKKGGKIGQKARLAKTLKSLSENDINSMVDKSIGEHYHSMTTKNEILEMIKSKINEQMPAPPKIKPDVKPDKKTTPEKPKHDDEPYIDPWKDPGKQDDPRPKFKKDTSDMPDFLKIDSIINSVNESKIDKIVSKILDNIKKK